jgi:hypothetical protein
VLNIQRKKCNWCDALLTNKMHFIGSEELPLHPVYICLGYTCHCGERVAVSRSEEGVQFDVPKDQIIVECSRGHSRTVLNREFLRLEFWKETAQ